MASTGCTALQGSATGGVISGNTSGAGFSAGDVITVSLNGFGAFSSIGLENTTAGTVLIADDSIQGARTYTVPANTAATFTVIGGLADPVPSYAWSCVSAAGSSGLTDSQKLTAVQTQASAIVANASGAAISGAVSHAADAALALCGPSDERRSQFVQPEPTRVARRRGAPGSAASPGRRAPVCVSQWSTWADVRGSGFDRSDSRTLNGTQINATGGVTYRLRPDLVIGAFAAYENFNYDVASLTGNLKGNGGTIGTYAGWQMTPTLRWKGMIGWTGLGYDASAGTAAGSFDGSRWLVSTGLTGSHRVATFILEPSVDVFALWERQSGYTDTLGALHDARNFSTGRVALGGRALAPIQSLSGVTPYLGFYGDFRFSTNNTVPVGVAFVGLNDGWSGRVTGGVNVAVAGGGTLALGGQYGGIGTDYGIWNGNARLNWPF